MSAQTVQLPAEACLVVGRGPMQPPVILCDFGLMAAAPTDFANPVERATLIARLRAWADVIEAQEVPDGRR